MSLDSDKKHCIAIFASGTGTNAVNICNYFQKNPSINIDLLVCNKPEAKVIKNIAPFNVPVLKITKDDFKNPQNFITQLKEHNISFIVLAGFLWLLPKEVVKLYPKKIVNIHPALLPSYGGKGMYGKFVHQSVVNAKEKYSGITIHYANEDYDEGGIIFQAKVELSADENPNSLAKKIHQLEHKHYPKVIENILEKM